MLAAHDKIAKILRADKHIIYKMEERLSYVTGKVGVLERIANENEEQIKNRLLSLGVSREASAKEVYDALISKIESDDNIIFEALKRPVCYRKEDCDLILNLAKRITGSRKGFFLKREKAVEFLEKEPPRKILDYLSYQSVKEMLGKEDLIEIYGALRFLEGSEWLNQTFFKQYESLKPSDFEEREVVVKALSERWRKVAEDFVHKKKHNISHLKEMGVVFVLPVALGISGELLRMLSLIFHYLREIPFYSDMFRKIAETPLTFPANLTSLLRGDVVEHRVSEGTKSLWLVVQRYLAKEDENDWRLFVPHINPEALHWSKSEEDLVKISEVLDGFGDALKFWQGLGWVGDFFKDEVGNRVLVSFDLVDTVMSLVKQKELTKYLYHHEEALWNEIFVAYFGWEELEKFCKEYLLQGYFEI